MKLNKTFLFLSLAGVLSICTMPLLAAEKLSKDDVMLLLLSGAPAKDKCELIQRRGIDFEKSAITANQLAELGAEESVLKILETTAGRCNILHQSTTASVIGDTRIRNTGTTQEPSDHAQIVSARKLARPHAALVNSFHGNKIGRITTAGVVTGEFSIPTRESDPEGITAGPDGNLWFTESSGNKIGRITTQ